MMFVIGSSILRLREDPHIGSLDKYSLNDGPIFAMLVQLDLM